VPHSIAKARHHAPDFGESFKPPTSEQPTFTAFGNIIPQKMT